jgi:hypothetical protein
MENDSTATSALCEAPHATGCIAFAERNVMEYPRTASLVRLDVGSPDHLAPFLSVVCEELAEVRRRSSQQRAAEVDQPRP